MDKFSKVSVIVVAGAEDLIGLRATYASFQRQNWPHKELILVSCLDQKLAADVQVKPDLDEGSLASGVKAAQGHVCVVWAPGWWYHQEVLGIHARLTEPWLTIEMRPAINSPVRSWSFYRRAYPVLHWPQMQRREVGGAGLMECTPETAQARGWQFYHSGNLGDIVYSLPALKILGSGTYHLGAEIRVNPKPEMRESMTPALVEIIAPLLLSQPYVRAVRYADKMPPVNHDFNLFRQHTGPGRNLVAQLLAACALNAQVFFDDQTPWLDVDPVVLTQGVVVHRSLRWRNPDFPWREVVDRYRPHLIFVGLPEEHGAFCADFGPVPYAPTKNLYELARIIAGCQLYVGNQSCPYSIAEGLKVNTVQETYPLLANCLFKRPNAVYGFNKYVCLPELKHLPPNPRRRKWRYHRRQAEIAPAVLTPPHVFPPVDLPGVPATINGLRRSVDRASCHLFNSQSLLQAIPLPPAMQRSLADWTAGRKGLVEAWFNPSLLVWNQRRYLAYRCECFPWFRLPVIALSELDSDWQPRLETTRILKLHTRYEGWCAEDPNFFVYKNEPWLSYTDARDICLARLTPDLEVAESFYLGRPGQEKVREKNWAFFEQMGRLYACYEMAPLRILEVNLAERATNFVYKHAVNPAWEYGDLRGGTAPVAHAGRFLTFFHSSRLVREDTCGPVKQYFIGAFAFELEPPFKPVTVSHTPLLAGQEEQDQYNRPSQHWVVFPGSAHRVERGWLVALGDNDCRCRLAFFDDEKINEGLQLL